MANLRNLIEQVEPAVTMSMRQLIWTAITGAGVGAVAWLLGQLLDAALFHFIFCRSAGVAGCATSSGYAEAAGLLIATGLGVWGLVRIQVFRPLLVGLAAALTLWGAIHALEAQSWPVALLIAAVLFAVAYAFYAWVMRLRSMLWAVVVTVLALIAVRFVLNS